MLLFLAGLFVGVVWGAGVVYWWRDQAAREKERMYRESKVILLRRLRVLREAAVN